MGFFKELGTALFATPTISDADVKLTKKISSAYGEYLKDKAEEDKKAIDDALEVALNGEKEEDTATVTITTSKGSMTVTLKEEVINNILNSLPADDDADTDEEEPAADDDADTDEEEPAADGDVKKTKKSSKK